MSTITAFWDRERTFKLTVPAVLELERTAGTGIGALSRRVIDGTFRHLEISETLRCALIGGGASPREAADLAANYIAAQPLEASQALAVQVLHALWFGPAPDAPNE